MIDNIPDQEATGSQPANTKFREHISASKLFDRCIICSLSSPAGPGFRHRRRRRRFFARRRPTIICSPLSAPDYDRATEYRRTVLYCPLKTLRPVAPNDSKARPREPRLFSLSRRRAAVHRSPTEANKSQICRSCNF